MIKRMIAAMLTFVLVIGCVPVNLAQAAGTADAEDARVVTVAMGESVTITDRTGNYADAVPVIEDSRIASVAISGGTTVVRSHGDAVTALADGKYLLVNNRAGKPMTNLDAASQQGNAGAMNGLSLEGTISDISANAVWTVTASGDGYTVQDADGKYLTIRDNDAEVVDEPSVVAVAYRNGTWTLSQNGAYLNDAANKGVCASGWDGDGYYDASTDAGSLWTIYPVTEETVSSTDLTFTGLYPGTTNIIVGDTLYQVRVTGQLREVDLKVGETAVFTDESGNYTGIDTSALDETVATVALAPTATQTKSLGSKVTALESGGQYILVNTRAGKPLTNAEAADAAATGAGSGLSLSGQKEDLAEDAIWTITGSNGTYTVRDSSGRYLTVGSASAGITGTATELTLNYNGSTWTIVGSGAYLNDFGGAGTCAAGWQNSAAPTDSGSQWDIYEVVRTEAEDGGTRITFTGVGPGETHVRIGDVMYHITVMAHSFDNGFCANCGEYQPAEQVDGVYRIGNAGQLYWFAKLVDGGTLDADAVLTADITVNADADLRKWNSIGSNAKQYGGTFDGQNFTVSGLYFDNDKTTGGYAGLIASLSQGGVVKNVTVADSFFCGYRYVGAIVGQNNGGTIENCHNDGTAVSGSSSYIGGITGGNSGTVTGCSSIGAVSSDAGNNIGGIAGTNAGTVERCANTGTVTSDCCSDEHCVGGITGENLGTIRNCYNTGAVSNDGTAAGGIAGKADDGIIENCYNVGAVSGKADAGGIVGKAYNAPTVANCYYLADSDTDALTGTAAKTAAAFASGEVTWLLNGSTAEGALVWKQTLGTDASPRFQGATVYYDSAAGTYSNEEPGQAPDPVEVIASGWSGFTTWELTSDGVLTFSPTDQKEGNQTNLRNYWKIKGVLTLPWGGYADMITKVVIEEGIHDIGQMAFYELPNLVEVQLPESAVEIRNYAFKNCPKLTTINLEVVEYIREGAFYGCAALTDVTFADGVVIEDWAFSKTSVTLP